MLPGSSEVILLEQSPVTIACACVIKYMYFWSMLRSEFASSGRFGDSIRLSSTTSHEARVGGAVSRFPSGLLIAFTPEVGKQMTER